MPHWSVDIAALLCVAALALVVLWLLRPGGVLVVLLALSGCVDPSLPAMPPDAGCALPDLILVPLRCGDQIPGLGYTGCLDCHDDTSRRF